MIGGILIALLVLLFGIGVLEFYDNRATWPQAWRGLATMGFSLAGMIVVLVGQGVI